MGLINNHDSERDVGSITYELKSRGAKQLATSSKSHVKAKLVDLIELKPVGEFKKHYKSAQKIFEITQFWAKNARRIYEAWSFIQEGSALYTDQRKMSDLNLLRELYGPFTNENDVDCFPADEKVSVSQSLMFYIIK